MDDQDHHDMPGLPRVIPVPSRDGLGLTRKDIALCTRAEADFFLGYLLYRTQVRMQAAQRMRQELLHRHGRAPDIPTLQDSDGRAVSTLPAWIPSNHLRLYAQLIEEDSGQEDDEGT